MAVDGAEEIVAEAQRKGDLIGVRMSISDDEGEQDPWTLPPSRKRHVFVLKGGIGKKQRRETAAALASVPDDESRVILATGSYTGEGFDDARLDTLFLAMPISWKGTLQQYVGRLHRLHDNKRFVQVYDYVDHYVPMLARMYGRRQKGYSTIGCFIEQEATPPLPPATAHP